MNCRNRILDPMRSPVRMLSTALAALTLALTSALVAPEASAQGLKLFGNKTASSPSSSLLSTTPEGTNGPTQSGELCMQKSYGSPVTNANRLNCTANDISIARAISVFPDSCVAGQPVDLRATFEVKVTANARYDAAFFFRTDGGANARGDGATASGQCSLSSLDPTVSPAQAIEGDSCGDLNAGTYTMTFDIPDVLCEDDDGNGLLNLPNCTSWHSNAGTSCSSDPFVLSSHAPETKSKCKCDDTFNVPVTVEAPGITVTKTASPDSVAETGSQVTFNVNVMNDANVVSVTVNTLTDNTTYAGLGLKNLLTIPLCQTGQPNAGFVGPCTPATATTACPSLANRVLAPQASASCQFSLFIAGNAGATITDTARACATSNANGQQACGDDTAEVVVTDISVDPTLSKTATAAACTVDATYMVSVSNNSTTDVLTISSLSDDKFGSITGTHAAGGGFGEVLSTTCSAGGNVAVGQSYNCSFVGRIVSGNCLVNHTNTVTGELVDDDDVEFTESDTATVQIEAKLQ